MKWLKKSNIRATGPTLSGEELTDIFMSMAVHYDSHGQNGRNEKTGIYHHPYLMAKTIAGYCKPTMKQLDIRSEVESLYDDANDIIDEIDEEYDGNIYRMIMKRISPAEKQEIISKYPTIRAQISEIQIYSDNMRSLFSDIVNNWRH